MPDPAGLLAWVEARHAVLAATARLTRSTQAALVFGGWASIMGQDERLIDAAARAASEGEWQADGCAAAPLAHRETAVGGVAVAAELSSREVALLASVGAQAGAALAALGCCAPAGPLVSSRTPDGGWLLGEDRVPPDRRAALERFREEVIADVAHELRTPLTAIRAHSEVLLDMAEDEPGGPRRFLEVVDAEAARMVGLIDDLRDVARGETGSTVAHRPWPSV